MEEDRLQSTRIVMRDYSKDYDCQNRGLGDSCEKDKDIAVFYFPGDGGTTAKDANGGCKIVESGLMLRFSNKAELYKQVSIYGLYYGFDNYRNDYGKMSRGEVSTFVKTYLMSRCVDRDKKLLSLDEICKEMSKVTFVGFCHGQEEICKVVAELRIQLEEKGFTEEETHKVASHLIAVSYSPDILSVGCPTIQAYSITDLIQRRDGLTRDSIDDYMNLLKIKLDGILVDFDKRGENFGEKVKDDFKIFYDFDRARIISKKLLNDRQNEENEHLFQWLARNDEWDIKYAKDKNLDCFSQLFFFALSYAVERSVLAKVNGNCKPIDMVDLYKSLCNIENSFSDEDLKERVNIKKEHQNEEGINR